MDAALRHVPVLLHTVVSVLSPQPGESVLDVTLGLGGHARVILERIGAHGHFTGLDADADNLSIARRSMAGYGNLITLIHANFLDIASLPLSSFDVIFADLGVSSPHLDDPERGFSFRSPGPLDLRYDRTTGETAADWIRRNPIETIVRALRDYGELTHAKRLAETMKSSAPSTTTDLLRCCESVFTWRAKSVLPQVFQALRIAVNNELVALDTLLTAAPRLLNPGGRMGVISYHSLEDRRVKQAFRSLTTPEKNPETGGIRTPSAFELLTRKALVPSEDEVRSNPRARSAKFRVIRRVPLAS